jgi:hypothetical protein
MYFSSPPLEARLSIQHFVSYLHFLGSYFFICTSQEAIFSYLHVRGSYSLFTRSKKRLFLIYTC